MKDYYFCAPSYDALAGMLTTVQSGYIQIAYPNVIGPAPGRSAIPAGTDQDGNPTPAVPASGDPAQWYVAIRSDDTIFTPSGVNVCDAATGQAVLGVWA